MSGIDFAALCSVADDIERYRLCHELPAQRKYRSVVQLAASSEAEHIPVHTLLTGEREAVELPRTLSVVLRRMQCDDYIRYTLCDTMKKRYDKEARCGQLSVENVDAVLRERVEEAAGDRFLRSEMLCGIHATKSVKRVLRAYSAPDEAPCIMPRTLLYYAASINNAADYFVIRDYTRHCDVRLRGEDDVLREKDLVRFVSRYLMIGGEERRRFVADALALMWR